jgi:hypothetical protein
MRRLRPLDPIGRVLWSKEKWSLLWEWKISANVVLGAPFIGSGRWSAEWKPAVMRAFKWWSDTGEETTGRDPFYEGKRRGSDDASDA